MRPSRLAAFFIALPLLGACAYAPTNHEFPRYDWYARTSGQLVIADFEAESGNRTPPLSPGFGVTLGGISDMGYDVAWAIEGTFEWSFHDMEESDNANYKRYLFGGRYFWNLDQKLRPSVSFGAAYHAIQFENIDHEFRIHGYGAYGGIGLDFQLTERWALGVDCKLHLLYAENDDQDDIVLWSVVGLWLTYYF